MRRIWDYISIRTKFILSTKQVMLVTTATLAVFHFCLMLFFLSYAIWPLAALNLFSVILYVVCFICAKVGRNLLKIFTFSYIEILINAVISTIFMGTDSGFLLYLFALIPIAYYAVYNFGSEEKHINPMKYILLSAAGFCVTRVVCGFLTPLYTYGNVAVERFVYVANYFITISAIVGFFSTLLNQIKTLEMARDRQNKKLERLSKTDPLTGLANRRSIQEIYNQSKNMREQYAVIMGDIDNFKKINDTYGHEAGDKVLKDVADAFNQNVRSNDSVCRWGGEEMLVFLPKCSAEAASAIAQRILEQIRLIKVDDTEMNVTITMGVAVSSEEDNFEEVTRRADERLYQGKTSGKNQVVSGS